jgi:hypothetical protein
MDDSHPLKSARQLFVDAVCEWSKARDCKQSLKDPLLLPEQRAVLQERMKKHLKTAFIFQTLAKLARPPKKWQNTSMRWQIAAYWQYRRLVWTQIFRSTL